MKLFLACVFSICLTCEMPAQESAPLVASLRLDNSVAQSPAIYLGNQLITRYIPNSNTKPILYPLLTAKGSNTVRNYPMAEGGEFEKKDHPHHRSFWFSYGEINEIDFWSEQAGTKQGYLISSNLQTIDNDDQIGFSCDWDWQGPDRKSIAMSKQQFLFSMVGSTVAIETKIELLATEMDLKFGDTKEGAFAVRVAGSMKVDAKLGGELIDSNGNINDAAWGKRADWVQYEGPVIDSNEKSSEEANSVDPPIASVTMLVHPQSFGYPGRWHVRTYGLFAHNPFGIRDFVDSEAASPGDETTREGGFVLRQGEQVNLRYLVLLNDGRLDSERIESIFRDFANR